MLTTNQQTVFDWINDELQLPVIAEAYRGALDLLNKKSPGYITFVAHAGRDLMNILVKEVRGKEMSGDEKRRVQYEKLVDDFKDDWKDEWGAEGFNKTDNIENGHFIPIKICKKIKNLIDEHAAGSLRASDRNNLFFSTFLGYSDGIKIGKTFFSEWKEAKEFFNAHAHLRRGNFSENEASKVEMHFQTLDNFLYKAATSEFGRMRSIREILEKANE